jgi:uncharacterized DUF497 family protein
LIVTLKERVEDGEQRWQTFGKVNGLLLLMIAHTILVHKQNESLVEVIRIISARIATRRERRNYEDEIG